MPSLLKKVQDAQKFLAHYPSFFSCFANVLQKLSIITILLISDFKLILAKETNKDNQNTELTTSQRHQVFKDLNKPALSLNKNHYMKPEEQKKNFEKKLYDAAQLYERQFLNEMVKAMRSTVTHSEYSQPTMAEKIYQDKMYDKYVQDWSDRGGVGFSKIIYNQLLERYSPYHNQKVNTQEGVFSLEKSSSKSFNKPPESSFKKLEGIQQGGGIHPEVETQNLELEADNGSHIE